MQTNQPQANLPEMSFEQSLSSAQNEIPDEDSETAPAVDLAVLEKLRVELVDVAPGLINELISLYVANTPRLLAELRLAIAEGDASTVNRTAHKLKANSARLGAMICKTLCQELEILGQQGELAGAAEKLVKLEREYERARAVLEMVE